MGTVKFELSIWDISELHLDNVKTRINALIATLKSEYPNLNFERSNIVFTEKKE